MGLFDPSKDKDIKPDDHIVNPPSSSLSSINSSSILKPSDQLDESLKSIITATNDITSHSISNLLDWSNKLVDSEFFNDNNQESTPSSSSSSSSSFKPSDYFFGDFNDERFCDRFRRRFKTNKSSPYGYWSYPVPSASLYKSCLDKDGLSAWDSHGNWRCLFPRAIIPDDGKGSHVLSKEDVLNDADHSKGLFFENFTDYLGFKYKMNEIIKKQKMEKWMKFRDERKKKWDFLKSNDPSTNDDHDGSLVQNDVSTSVTSDRAFATNGRIRGSSSSTTIKTLENGDVEKFTVLKQLYDDGSSEVSEFKEILNQDGERKSFDENIKKYPKKGGWFWDSSDKN